MPSKKKPSQPQHLAIPPQMIERRIYLIRSEKVMLSSDLADLYQVEPRALVQAVKRNIDRFPADFMFQLTKDEANNLKSQNVISSGAWGGARRATPYTFTEQGVAMLSSVLNSPRAILVNIAIIRAFVKLRELLSTHKDLARKLDDMEQKYDSQFKAVFDAIRKLMQAHVQQQQSPQPTKAKIGFNTNP